MKVVIGSVVTKKIISDKNIQHPVHYHESFLQVEIISYLRLLFDLLTINVNKINEFSIFKTIYFNLKKSLYSIITQAMPFRDFPKRNW